MRAEVQACVADGALPDLDASKEEIGKRGRRLALISRPVTSEEAQPLAACFGPDDCHGVAWTLLHLIETAPGPLPQPARPGPEPGDWQPTLGATGRRGEPA